MNFRKVVSLEACARELNEVVPAKRLRELCASGHLPHVIIDGQPFVEWPKVETWIQRNLVGQECKGTQLPGKEREIVPRGPRAVPELRPLGNRLRRIHLFEYPPGVYFLVQGDAVIYVGKSATPLLRVADHRKHREFEHAFYIPIPLGRLDEVEGAFIRHFRPPLNLGCPADRGRDVEVLEEFGIVTRLLGARVEPSAEPVQ